MSLTREAFKNIKPTSSTIGEVEVPALGGKVFLRKISAAGRDRVQHALFNGKEQSYRAQMVCEVACDDIVKRLFSQDDCPWLAELDYDVLEPIVAKANALNDYEKPEQLEKN